MEQSKQQAVNWLQSGIHVGDQQLKRAAIAKVCVMAVFLKPLAEH
jgi:hypothetical protein